MDLITAAQQVAADKDLNPTSWHYQGDLPSTYTFYCLTCLATWEAEYVPSQDRFIRGQRLV
jgi:hypothetical protein